MLGTDLPLINYAQSIAARDAGMIAAANGYGASEWIAKARSVAEMLAGKYGETTIDRVLSLCPRPPSVSPNATGSIFKSKKFRCVGITESSQVQRHAGTIRRWALT